MRSNIIFQLLLIILILQNRSNAQVFNQILGRPTDTSITIGIISDTNIYAYYELGTKQGTYELKSNNFNALSTQPNEIEVNRLMPNTRYYYRLCYKFSDTALAYSFATERTFTTQRSKGTSFSFAVEADPHLDTNCIAESFSLTLKHMLSKKIDFLVDLGDNTMNDKLPLINDSTIKDRTILFRKYFAELCHSAALYVAMGNHEGELGWLENTNLSFLPTLSANIRKSYFPNPFPNSFYSGNTTPTPGVGFRENYYAWEWGDALFVVIDPYFYTKTRPGWGWTLGFDQYSWLSATLKKSTAKYKFVFSHQLVGGSGTDGRGGTEFVNSYEMGGYNDDSTWGFTKFRPGWEMPIHKLFVDTKVNVFFHGHDHFYGRQVKDGVIYQEVPQPSARNINTITGTAYGYKEGVFLPSRGYLLVTVNADSANVEYVRTFLPTEENASRSNGTVAYGYTIRTGLLTSVRDMETADWIHLGPNPAKDHITISTARLFNQFTYRLIDYTGRVLATGNSYKINLTGMKSGNYILQMKFDQFYINKKIVVLE